MIEFQRNPQCDLCSLGMVLQGDTGTRRANLCIPTRCWSVDPSPVESPSESTTVVHCKRDPYDVYIGRPSVFGNPFLVREVGRKVAIEKYGQWVRGEITVKGSTPPTKEQIGRLQGKTLGCWCSPQACHGDILAKMTEEFTSPPEPSNGVGGGAAIKSVGLHRSLDGVQLPTTPLKKLALVIIGKAPGKNETDKGECFVGMAGDYLDAWLKSMNFPDSVSVYLTNTVRCRLVPRDDGPITKEQSEACRSYLAADLRLIQAQHETILLLCLGGHAVQALGLGSIRDATRRQGQVVPITEKITTYRLTKSKRTLMWEPGAVGQVVDPVARDAGAVDPCLPSGGLIPSFPLKVPGLIKETEHRVVGEYPVFCTYHPAATLPWRQPALMHAVADHLQLLSDRILQELGILEPSRLIKHPKVHMCLPPNLDNPPVILSLDIETYGIDDSLGIPQTVFHPKKMMAIDGCPREKLIRTVAVWSRGRSGGERSSVFLWDNPKHRETLLDWLRLARYQGAPLVSMNTLFDVCVLRAADDRFRIVVAPPMRLEDVAIWNYLNNSERPERSLESLSRLFGYLPAPTPGGSFRKKKFTTYPSADDPKGLQYVLGDAQLALRVRDHLMDGVLSQARTPETSDWYNDLLWLCVQMAESGLPYSSKKLETLLFQTERDKVVAEHTVRKLGYGPLAGPGSLPTGHQIVMEAVQVAGLAEDKRLAKTKATGRISADKANRNLLLGSVPLKFERERTALQAFSDFKSAAKLRDSYILPLLGGGDRKDKRRLIQGVAYPTWFPVPAAYDKGQGGAQIGGTKQSRMVAQGPATQTDPPEVQACYEPLHPGWVLLKGDLARIELMVAALFSGDKRMLHDIDPSFDMHGQRAIEFFGEEVRKKSDWSKWRHAGKTANFWWIFRGGPRILIEQVRREVGFELTEDQARRFHRLLPVTYPGLYKMQSDWINEATRRGYLDDPVLGQRRWLTQSYAVNSRDLESTICNYRIQTVAANIMCDIMIRFHKLLSSSSRWFLGVNIGWKSRIHQNVYDAVRWSAPLYEAESSIKLLNKALKDSWYVHKLFQALGRTIPITFEVSRTDREETQVLESPYRGIKE